MGSNCVKVLVTGGTGFIGTHLVDELVKRGEEVRSLVRKTSNVRHLKKSGVELVYGDITNMDSLKKAVKGIDVVYHLVGGGSVSTISKEGYLKLRNLNVTGTKNLLKACSSSNIRKFLLFSSVAAIGFIKDVAVDENTACKPEIPHELVKYESEQVALKYCKKNKIALVIIRPTLVYGPRDVKSEILKMCKLIKKHIFPIIGKGDNVVPMVYVENLIQATILAGERESNTNEIYIITDQEHPMNEIVYTIAKELNIKLWGVHVPILLAKIGVGLIESLSRIFNFTPPFNLKRIESITANRFYDISKAKKELGYKPIQLMTGIKQSIDWYKKNGYLDREEIQVSSIKSLYLTALLEGEGLGTAYEYFAKWRILMKIFRKIGYPKNILVAGLPEKYGSSMDFVLFAQKYNLNITIVDDRVENINKFKKILELAKEKEDFMEITEIDRLSDLKLNLKEKYDLLLCCEVLQRLSEEERTKYFNQIGEIAENALIFVPNKENRSHAKLSGLNALNLNELSNYCQRYDIIDKGYVDMPPFPPGLKRSEEDRQKVTESFLQKSFMKTLELWAGSEAIFPKIFKRRFSHIIYCGIACNT